MSISDGDLSILGNFLDFEETFGSVKSDVEAKIIIPSSDEKTTIVQIDGKGKIITMQLSMVSGYLTQKCLTVTTDSIKFNEDKAIRQGLISRKVQA